MKKVRIKKIPLVARFNLLATTTITVVLLNFIGFSCFAQINDNSPNTFHSPKVPRDRIIVELAHTGWLNMPNHLRETWSSGGVNFYFYFDYPLTNTKFSLAWGFGLSSHNIHGKIQLNYLKDSLQQKITYTSIEPRLSAYKINRIGFKIIELPLELRFRSQNDANFKLMLGFKMGYVIQTFTKIFDDKGKIKSFDIFGVNPWRYGPTLRIGFEQVHLTFFYALSEVFNQGQGTQGIVPFSFGIAYTPRITIGSGKG